MARRIVRTAPPLTFPEGPADVKPAADAKPPAPPSKKRTRAAAKPRKRAAAKQPVDSVISVSPTTAAVPSKEPEMPPKKPPANPTAADKADEIASALEVAADDAGDPFSDLPSGGGDVPLFDEDDLTPPASTPRSRAGGTAQAPMPPPPPLQRPPAQPRPTPMPRKVDQVLRAPETITLVGVDRGKELYVGPYSVQEIAAGGGIYQFLQRFVAPNYPTIGLYRVYVDGKQGPELRQEVSLATPTGAAGPWGAPAPGWSPSPWGAPGPASGGIGEQADALGKVMSAVEQQRRAAAAEQEAQRKREEGVLGMVLGRLVPPGGQASGSMDPMSMMLIMKMLEPKADNTERIYRDFSDALRELNQGVEQRLGALQQSLEQRLAMVSVPMPPMPPPGPGPMEWAQAFGPLFAPLLRQPDILGQLAAVKEIFGSGDRPTLADVQLAGLNAKLEMLTGQPRNGTLDDLAKFAEFMESIRPTSDPWVTVAEKAIDKLPDLVDKVTGAAALSRIGAAPTKKVTVKKPDGTKKLIPIALVEAVKMIEDTDLTGEYDHTMPDGTKGRVTGEFRVIAAVLGTGKPLIAAGDPWAGDVKTLLAATTERDLKAINRAFAALLARAFGSGEKVKAVHRKVMRVWRKNIDAIAGFLGARVAAAEGGAEAEAEAEAAVEEEQVESAADALAALDDDDDDDAEDAAEDEAEISIPDMEETPAAAAPAGETPASETPADEAPVAAPAKPAGSKSRKREQAPQAASEDPLLS